MQQKAVSGRDGRCGEGRVCIWAGLESKNVYRAQAGLRLVIGPLDSETSGRLHFDIDFTCSFAKAGSFAENKSSLKGTRSVSQCRI